MEERFNRHWARRKDKTPMARALLKYGKDSFIIGMIEFCDEKKKMFNREKYWIKSYNSNNRNFGYNATEGGDSGPIMYGEKNPNFGKKNFKLSELNKKRKGEKRSKEVRKKISDKLLGKKHSNKTKELMSDKRKLSWENGTYDNIGEKISKSKKGKKTKRRISILCLNNNEIYDSYTDAAKELGLAVGNISCVVSGKFKHTKGYKFIKT
jgi:group I intron endonuclease